jgi:hypothetical protein
MFYGRTDRLERRHERGLQFLARGAQRDAAVGPVEQAYADPRFRAFDGMTECGCADAKFQRGSAEAAMLATARK